MHQYMPRTNTGSACPGALLHNRAVAERNWSAVRDKKKLDPRLQQRRMRLAIADLAPAMHQGKPDL